MTRVLIIPSDDRQLQVALIEKYNRAGVDVFFPSIESFDFLNWKKIAKWPALLTKNLRDPSKRNLEMHPDYYGNEEDDTIFGEDTFIFAEGDNFLDTLYQEDIRCEIVNLAELEKDYFDFYHTTRGSGADTVTELNKRMSQQFPTAKWICSSCNPGRTPELSLGVKNVMPPLPAAYDTRYPEDKFNVLPIFGSKFELSLLNVPILDSSNRVGAASFSHNMSRRHPLEYQIFQKTAHVLKEELGIELINYGGNASGVGADISFDGAGPNGSFKTLSVREALIQQQKLALIVNLKSDDWGGGMVYNSLYLGVPLLVHEAYFNKTHMGRYFQPNVHCLVAPYIKPNGALSLDGYINVVGTAFQSPEAFLELSENCGKLYSDIENHFHENFSSFLEKCE